LNEHLKINPENYPLTMQYAEVLLKLNRASQAEELLERLTATRPGDVELWYLLAETYGLANNIPGVHQARAEFFVLTGNLDQAVEQLGFALPLVADNFQITARITERIQDIHKLRQRQKNL
jgi:predicted Zn-dependent protease